ncbi:MAG TPA: O-antigen ligase [Xanthomonadaceae bacterium]|jgi:O-antigen ligase|nr:O-antigen ligase [Xanthomonadaceae bacterium]
MLAFGAIFTVFWLGLRRFRGGDALLSREAWALTTALFFSYWLPELLSCVGAFDPLRSLYEVLVDLRYLPFLWLTAIAVHREEDRHIVYVGIAAISIVWALDGLLQAATGYSMGGHAVTDRISGVFGQHPHLGQVLASLAAFPLGIVGRRTGAIGWFGIALLIGVVILLSGSRAAWITFGLALLFSGWRLLGWKRMVGVFAAGVIGLIVLVAVFPRNMHERVARTEDVFSGDAVGLDQALSGRLRIWEAAACMTREHPINGVGVRGYRDAYAGCAPQNLGPAAWGTGGALHAHQIVLEILSETGVLGLLFWLVGTALAIRAWRWATPVARARAAIPAVALAVTVFPLNTHLAFYSSFWGGLTLLLTALYAGALFGDDATTERGDTRIAESP